MSIVAKLCQGLEKISRLVASFLQNPLKSNPRVMGKVTSRCESSNETLFSREEHAASNAIELAGIRRKLEILFLSLSTRESRIVRCCATNKKRC